MISAPFTVALSEELEQNENLQHWQEQILECARLRMEAADLQEQASALVEKANTILTAIATATGIGEYKTTAGTLIYIPGKPDGSTSFKKDKLKKYLVSKGVSAELVAEAMLAATEKGPKKDQVQWRAKKEE